MPFLNDPSRIQALDFSAGEKVTLNKISVGGKLGGGFIVNGNIRVLSYDFKVSKDYYYDVNKMIVDSILQDRNHWLPLNVMFVQFWESKDREADVHIHLLNTAQIRKKCGKSLEEMSCAIVGGNQIYLNGNNWMLGSEASKLTLNEYRKYVLTHEMCHILGYLHESCTHENETASIMHQQTLGGCKPNGAKLEFKDQNPPKIKTKYDI